MRFRKGIVDWTIRVAVVLTLVSALYTVQSQVWLVTRPAGYAGHVQHLHLASALSMYYTGRTDFAILSDVLRLMPGPVLEDTYARIETAFRRGEVDRSKIDYVTTEIGSVLYYYAAFLVLGPHQSSVERMWLFVAILSLWIYFATFFRNRAALLLLGAVGVAISLMSSHAAIRLFGFAQERATPVLGFLPFAHLLVASLSPPDENERGWHLAALVAQAAILVFWIFVRANNLAYLAALAAVLVVIGMAHVRARRKASPKLCPADVGVARTKSAALAFGFPLAIYLVVRFVVFPSVWAPGYAGRAFHHLFWHPVVVGLACEGKDPCLAISLSDGSAVELVAKSKYNETHAPLEYGASYERVLRQEFTDCVRRMPGYYWRLFMRRVTANADLAFREAVDLAKANRKTAVLGLGFAVGLGLALQSGALLLAFGIAVVVALTYGGSLIYCTDTYYLAPLTFMVVIALFTGIALSARGVRTAGRVRRSRLRGHGETATHRDTL